MSEVDDFLSKTLPSLIEAERALHNGDVEPRLAQAPRVRGKPEPEPLLAFCGARKLRANSPHVVVSRHGSFWLYDFVFLGAPKEKGVPRRNPAISGSSA